jgi:hypothetical protein
MVSHLLARAFLWRVFPVAFPVVFQEIHHKFGVFARIFSKTTLLSFKVKSMKEPPDEESRNLVDSALRPNLNC